MTGEKLNFSQDHFCNFAHLEKLTCMFVHWFMPSDSFYFTHTFAIPMFQAILLGPVSAGYLIAEKDY